MKIIASIITYNPDIARLTFNIKAIFPQVDEVVLIDNGSKNINNIKSLICNYKSIDLIKACAIRKISAAFMLRIPTARKINPRFAEVE